MGLSLSGDLLLDELNNIDDSSRNFRMIKGLVSTIKKVSFLGLWNASTNQPPLDTGAVVDEGSFYNVSVGSETSVVGRCLSGDWIVYLNNNWSVIRVSFQESVSNILLITPPNNITVRKSSSIQDGYLSSTDWTLFNSKQQAIENSPSVLKFSDSSSSASDTILSARVVQSLVSGSVVTAEREIVPNTIWNSLLNRPELRDDAGVPGFYYQVSHTATVDLGLGARLFVAKSIIKFNVVSRRWE